ncbi:kismet isoform c [Anaeramoeba flamelloides]|uniref:Kismet isoform c n=1 Tax=Anaeramoeba flamelloides TaxID=1746091 RepID=A0AAV8AG40_9EUKA|nr:kismet isoform c [Anaeramoeba flamelloides]
MTNPHFTLPLTGSLNSFSNFLNSNLQPQNTSQNQNQNQNQNNTSPLPNQSLTNQQNQPVVSMELRLGSLNYLQDPNNTTMPSLTQQPSDSIYTNNNFLNTNLNQLSNFSQLQKQPLINSTIQNNVPPPISTSTSTSTTQENPPKKKSYRHIIYVKKKKKYKKRDKQAYSNKAVRNFITEDITYKRKNNKKRITTKKIIGRNQYPDNQDIILENANNEVFITNNQPLEEPGLNLDLEEEIIEEAEEEETDEEDEFNWKSEEKKNRSLVTAVPVKRRSSRRNTKILEVKLDESSNSEEYYATDSEPEKEKSAISKTRPKTNQAQIQNQNQNLNQNQKLEEKETIKLNNVNVLPTGNNSIQSEVNQQNSNYVDNFKIQENSGMVNNNANNNNNMALENNEIYQYYNEPQTLPFFQKKLQKILTRRDPDDKDNNSRFLKSISQNTSAGKSYDKDSNDDNNNIKERKFLVKWRGVSYIHVEWVNEEELLKQHMGRSRVKKFNEKIFPEMLEEVKNEPFNTDFFEVDRILDLITLEKTQNYNGTWGWRVLPRTSIEQKEENENESQTTIEANIEIKTETETKKGTETQTKTETETETETKTGTGTKKKKEMENIKSTVPLVFNNIKTHLENLGKENKMQREEIYEGDDDETEQEYYQEGEPIIPIQFYENLETNFDNLPDTIQLFLVKWSSLSYQDSTWEMIRNINDDKKIKEFYERENSMKKKIKDVKKVITSKNYKKWEEKTESPKYKNDMKLRSYQVEGLNWLSFNWNINRNGILADQMGLGKSIQTIAILEYLKNEKNINGPFLVIVPLSTLSNWEREFERWSNLNSLTYHGTTKSRAIIRQNELFYRGQRRVLPQHWGVDPDAEQSKGGELSSDDDEEDEYTKKKRAINNILFNNDNKNNDNKSKRKSNYNYNYQRNLKFYQQQFNNELEGNLFDEIENLKKDQEELKKINKYFREQEHGQDNNDQEIDEEELFSNLKITDLEIENKIFKFDVLITTYEMAVADKLFLSRIDWEHMVLDEGHKLKNYQSKTYLELFQYQSEHILLLTGTPLQNNIEELWALLHFLEPIKFQDREGFIKQFGDMKDSTQVEKLHKVLKPHLLRRLKTDVEKSIAPKEETIIEVELTKFQKQYYRAVLKRNIQFLSQGNSSTKIPRLVNVVMQLRKICNHPYLIQGAEEFANQDLITKDDKMKTLIMNSGKFVLLDKLLTKLKNQGSKVLIFSQMVKVLDIIEEYFNFKEYNYERIDGSIRGNVRQSAIDRFMDEKYERFAFLLCTRAGGLGINLTSANTVIIFDSDWNPQNDIQAMDRCHRIGQTKLVKVYRLITRNTYEREMFDRASKKLGLDHAVLTNITNKSNNKKGKRRTTTSALSTSSKKASASAAAASSLEQSLTSQISSKKNSKGKLNSQEINDLLKYGAYDLFHDNGDSEKFCEEDIDQILEGRTMKVTHGSNENKNDENNKNSSFSRATFVSEDADTSLDINDPNFWQKLIPDKKKRNYETENLMGPSSLSGNSHRRVTRELRKSLIKTMKSKNEDDDYFDKGIDVDLGNEYKPDNNEFIMPMNNRFQNLEIWYFTERDRCLKDGLLHFGYGGRWGLLKEVASLKRLSIKKVKRFTTSIIRLCLAHINSLELEQKYPILLIDIYEQMKSQIINLGAGKQNLPVTDEWNELFQKALIEKKQRALDRKLLKLKNEEERLKLKTKNSLRSKKSRMLEKKKLKRKAGDSIELKIVQEEVYLENQNEKLKNKENNEEKNKKLKKKLDIYSLDKKITLEYKYIDLQNINWNKVFILNSTKSEIHRVAKFVSLEASKNHHELFYTEALLQSHFLRHLENDYLSWLDVFEQMSVIRRVFTIFFTKLQDNNNQNNLNLNSVTFVGDNNNNENNKNDQSGNKEIDLDEIDHDQKSSEIIVKIDSLLELPMVSDKTFPAKWWSKHNDRMFLYGIFKHGFNNFEEIRSDPYLGFDNCQTKNEEKKNNNKKKKKRTANSKTRKRNTKNKKNNKDSNDNNNSNRFNNKNTMKTQNNTTPQFSMNDNSFQLTFSNSNNNNNNSNNSNQYNWNNQQNILNMNNNDYNDFNYTNFYQNMNNSNNLNKNNNNNKHNNNNSNSNDNNPNNIVNFNNPNLIKHNNNTKTRIWPAERKLNKRLLILINGYKKLINYKNENPQEENNFSSQKNKYQNQNLGLNQKKWNKKLLSLFFQTILQYGIPLDQNGNEDFYKFYRLLNITDKSFEEISDLLNEYLNSCRFATKTKSKDRNNITEESDDDDDGDNGDGDDENGNDGEGDGIDANNLKIPLKTARRVIERIDLIKKITLQILPLPNLTDLMKTIKHLKTCPDYWVNEVHDLALLKSVATHGFPNPETLLKDVNLPFYHEKVKWDLLQQSQYPNFSSNVINVQEFPFLKTGELFSRVKAVIRGIERAQLKIEKESLNPKKKPKKIKNRKIIKTKNRALLAYCKQNQKN